MSKKISVTNLSDADGNITIEEWEEDQARDPEVADTHLQTHSVPPGNSACFTMSPGRYFIIKDGHADAEA